MSWKTTKTEITNRWTLTMLVQSLELERPFAWQRRCGVLFTVKQIILRRMTFESPATEATSDILLLNKTLVTVVGSKEGWWLLANVGDKENVLGALPVGGIHATKHQGTLSRGLKHFAMDKWTWSGCGDVQFGNCWEFGLTERCSMTLAITSNGLRSRDEWRWIQLGCNMNNARNTANRNASCGEVESRDWTTSQTMNS